MSGIMLFSFIFYLVLVVILGIVAYRVTSNLSDYILGGRSLGGPVAALSSGASDMSAWLLMGLPGAVLVSGANQIWLPIGLTIGAYLNWLIIAKPLRIYTEKANDALTIPSFLNHRFGGEHKSIRLISSLATMLFFTFYSASGLVGAALLLELSFPGLEFTQCLMIAVSIIVGYTFVGGFLAVSWTDFFQGTLMLFCMLLIPKIAMNDLGGWDAVSTKLLALGPEYSNILEGMTFLGILNLASWGLGYFGQPHILVRFMAVKSTNEIPLARRICMSWMVLSMIGAMCTGAMGAVYFEGHAFNPESVFIVFSTILFSPWISGLILAAILSSIVCALDSQLLASSSALTEDFYHVLFRPKAKGKELMWVSRFSVILLALVATSIAYFSDGRILDIVGFAWAGLASTFAAPVCLSLFWRRTTEKGVICGMLAGATTVIISKYLELPVYEIMPGIAISALGVLIGSFLSKAPNAAIVGLFDEVKLLCRKA